MAKEWTLRKGSCFLQVVNDEVEVVLFLCLGLDAWMKSTNADLHREFSSFDQISVKICEESGNTSTGLDYTYLYMVERFSANFSEIAVRQTVGGCGGSRGKFKTVQAFLSNSVLRNSYHLEMTHAESRMQSHCGRKLGGT